MMISTLSRRSFVAGSAAAAFAGINALVPTSLRGATQTTLPGIQLYMVQAELKNDPAGTLRKLAAIGYPYVEYFGMAGLDPAEFRKMVDDAGLSCPCGHFGFGFVETSKLLDDAATVGAHYVISSTLLPRSLKGHDSAGLIDKMNHLDRDDFKRIAANASEIGKAAHERGLQYAYHNHLVEFRTFEQGETGYSILMKETEPEMVKFEADLGWMAAGGGDSVAIIKSAPKRFPLLHFKDFSVLNPPVNTFGTERQQQIVELGQGLVPFKQIVAEAKKIGVERYIVDHDPPFHNKTAFEAAKIDFDYLSGLLAT